MGNQMSNITFTCRCSLFTRQFRW